MLHLPAHLRLLGIVTPVLQRPSTLRVRVLLCFALLRQVALVVRDDLAHVREVVFVVLAWVLLWILLEDGNDLAAALIEVSLA